MKIETEHLTIRSLAPGDAPAFVEMAADGSLREIFGDCSRCGEWMGDWISESLTLEAEGNPRREYIAFAVADRGGRVMGSVGTTYYEDLGRVGVTYFLGAAFRGRGYMAEALRAFAEYALARYDLDELFACASVDNVASCRTLERAGFTLTATRMYRDMYDDAAELCNFYELKRGEGAGRSRATR